MAGSFESILVLQMAKSLRLADVFHLQATNIPMREACLEKPLWHDLLSSEFPLLELSPALLQSTCKHDLVPLLRELQQPQACITGPEHMQLKSLTEVQKLARSLSAANRSVHAWLSQGGHSGYVLAGRMCFPSEGLAMALPKRSAVLGIRTNAEMGFPLCMGDFFPVQCTGPLDNRDANSGGPSATPDKLFLRIAWQDGRFLLAMHSDGDVSCFATVFVDIAVCSSAFTLNYRNIEVAVNGTWHTCCKGLFDMTGGRAATMKALSNGVPCVVCIRHGQSTPTCKQRVSASLNLDSLRR